MMENMKEVLEQAVKEHAFEYAVIPTEAITFSRELIKACEANVCGKYNKSWTCPPAIGPMETQKKKITAFSSAFVFSTKSSLEDSFDYEGMMRAKALRLQPEQCAPIKAAVCGRCAIALAMAAGARSSAPRSLNTWI